MSFLKVEVENLNDCAHAAQTSIVAQQLQKKGQEELNKYRDMMCVSFILLLPSII